MVRATSLNERKGWAGACVACGLVGGGQGTAHPSNGTDAGGAAFAE